MKIHPKGNPTILSTVLPPLPIETTFQRVGAEFFFLGAAFFMATFFSIWLLGGPNWRQKWLLPF